MHQTSTEYCLAVASLTLMPINPLDHVIARCRRVYDLIACLYGYFEHTISE